MTIRSRLKRIEGSQPGPSTVLWFQTVYEGMDGTPDAETGLAVLQRGATYLGTEAAAAGETFENFQVRIAGAILSRAT